MSDWVIVAGAGFIGGLMNALAGGGSFATLPALIYVGVPPVFANATGTAALLPGYMASAWRYRGDIVFPAGLSFTTFALTAFAGGSLGAVILLNTSQKLFAALIPWLILLATVMFIIGPRLVAAAGASTQSGTHQGSVSRRRKWSSVAALFVVCVYGGYFNGGLGIILLALFALMGQTHLPGMNGVKSLASTLLTSIAVAVYAVGGVIVVGHLLLLGAAAIVGGYTGAAIVYRIPPGVLRWIVVAIGLMISLGFFLNQSE